MSRLPILLFLALPCSTAFAQNTTDAADQALQDANRRWTLGVAASAIDSPYAGEGTRFRPLPLVRFQGERFFLRGGDAGVHLFKRDAFNVDAFVSGRFDGFDIDDLGRTELAANGVDAALLEDRDDGLDAGLAAGWLGRAGRIRLRAVADVSGTSDGLEASLDYGYPIRWGRTTIEPIVGARWMSSDLADYYYGTLDAEVARGVPLYRPGAAVVPRLGLSFARALTPRWTLVGRLEYEILPDEITDSPLLEPDTDGTASLMIGIGRSF